jgi:large subunit ribosomal protein L32
MGALPKQRISRARQGNRRAHDQLPVPHIMECPNCHNLHRAHFVCPHCGTYKGMQVVELKEEKAKES